MGRRTAKGQINHSKRTAGRVQIGLRPGIEDGEIIASNEIFQHTRPDGLGSSLPHNSLSIVKSSSCLLGGALFRAGSLLCGLHLPWARFGGIVVEAVVVEVVKVWMPVLAFPDGGEGALDEDRILSLAMTSPAHHWVPADTIFLFVNTKAKLVPGADQRSLSLIAINTTLFTVLDNRLQSSTRVSPLAFTMLG
ncbi:hypothetical protein CAPTEDRAFT_216905 [Capitella teleta]|uniref:Uncharacterized protein n=1 Tax=Capitella teleta TaxID=283909 RepID=R7VMC7_CAPTE|nr:hypothetical protein CAPTEDRAFT_216905 [Capitella teleta]|eukprot:ELU18610.1 hypothetical protein CAPTEDRAFT_216905 [Capitella teleta]